MVEPADLSALSPIAALLRTHECFMEGEDTDIGRTKLDALVVFGWLERVRYRQWKITNEGEHIVELAHAQVTSANASPLPQADMPRDATEGISDEFKCGPIPGSLADCKFLRPRITKAMRDAADVAFKSYMTDDPILDALEASERARTQEAAGSTAVSAGEQRVDAVVAAARSTDDPIEQMLKVVSVAADSDLLISRKWVQTWAEQWRAGRARLAAPDMESKDAVAPGEDVAWLIERDVAGNIHYLREYKDRSKPRSAPLAIGWTTDANHAKKFTTEAAAKARALSASLIEPSDIWESAKVVEHMWLSPPPTTGSDGQDTLRRLIEKWRAVNNYTPAPVQQIYHLAADELNAAMAQLTARASEG